MPADRTRAPEDIPGPAARAWQAYRMRWKRRRLVVRAWRKGRELIRLGPAPRLPRGAIPCFAVMRDEALRLPHWLDHHRALGVDHFLIVDNGSTDGTLETLRMEPDVTVWRTGESYRAARFGVDWLGALQRVHGAGRWTLTLDADELLIYPHWEDRPLAALAAELDRRGQPALGALMVELYPPGRLSTAHIVPGQSPLDVLKLFDAGPYRARRQRPARNLWVQGGPRARLFFADAPDRAPTLNKLPFVKWRRGTAYLNACHALLPPRLNLAWDGPGDTRLSGALLHTKFLDIAIDKAEEEKTRGAHFGAPAAFRAYHDAVAADPSFAHAGATRFGGWRQLAELGLMSDGGWR